MLKRITLFAMILCLSSFPLMAQDDELPEGSIDVDLAVVSNYVWRGGDILGANLAQQRQDEITSNTEAWTFQPSITYNTPIDGLYFNIWGSFAMHNREDQDVDLRIQQGPGGSDVVSSGNLNDLIVKYFPPGSSVNGTLTPSNFFQPDCQSTTSCLPGTYDEQNGLERLDEVDLTIGYEMETTIGTLGYGYIAYTLPNIKAKGDSVNEIFFSYAPPGALSNLSFIAYTDITTGGASNNYLNLSYGDSIEVSEGISVDGSIGVGYGIKSYLQGVQDVTGSIGVSLYGFSVAFNTSYRPDIRFHDTDNGGRIDDSSAVAFLGSSSRADGLVTNNKYQYGYLNSIFFSNLNTALASANPFTGYTYSYTPRQKLPKWVNWISVSYSFSI